MPVMLKVKKRKKKDQVVEKDTSYSGFGEDDVYSQSKGKSLIRHDDKGLVRGKSGVEQTYEVKRGDGSKPKGTEKSYGRQIKVGPFEYSSGSWKEHEADAKKQTSFSVGGETVYDKEKKMDSKKFAKKYAKLEAKLRKRKKKQDQ